jgi:hypothetical protein
MKNYEYIPPLTTSNQSAICHTCYAFEGVALKNQLVLEKENRHDDKALYGAEAQTYHFFFSQCYHLAV